MGNSNSKPPREAPTSPSRSVNINHMSSRSSTLNSKSSLSRHKHSSADHSEKQNATKTYQPPLSPTTSATEQGRNNIDSTMGNEQSGELASPSDHHDEAGRIKSKATPVRVPRPSPDAKRQRGPDTQFEPSGPPRDPNFISHSNFGPPPSLPLPIGEELHTPGSPIINALGSSGLHEDDIQEGQLPRQTSAVSNTTLEDDELGNELRPCSEVTRGTIPYTVYWKQGGERVYVTGTFTGWSRKYRMEKE